MWSILVVESVFMLKVLLSLVHFVIASTFVSAHLRLMPLGSS